MSSNEKNTKLGARVLPGVDLTLWFNLVLMTLVALALVGGGVAVAIH